LNLNPKVVEDQLRKHIAPPAKLLVAVSGGVDSVVLAHLIKSLQYPLVIGHVDHRIRAGSHRDAAFVRRLAARWHIPFRLSRIHVPSRARASGMGLEEAAREARYAALRKIAESEGCNAVLTAHSADDQAETVLMHFLRGTGLTGLAGMAPARQLSGKCRLIRPLLDVPRKEIENYGRKHGLAYRNDSSNRNRKFFRNRIRLDVIPELESIVPGLRERLVQMADVFRAEEDFSARQMTRIFSKTARKNNSKGIIDLKHFLRYHKALQRRLIRQMAGSLSFRDMERLIAFAATSANTPSLQLNRRLALMRRGRKLIISGHRYRGN